VQVIDVGNRLIIKPDDHIPSCQTRLLCRALLFDGHDQNTGFHGKVKVPDETSGKRNILSTETDVTPPDSAFLD
jgi:hypothetical protein